MYLIIGGDGQEYGPASLEQLKTWLAEGRITPETHIKKQGEDAWFTLAEFPEVFHSQPAEALPVEPIQPVEKVKHPEPLGEMALLSRDYEIDVIDCFQRGFRLVKKNWKAAICAAFWVTVIPIVISYVLQSGSNIIWNQVSVDAEKSGHISWALLSLGVVCSFIINLFITLFTGILTGSVFFFFLQMVRGEILRFNEVLSKVKASLKQLVLMSIVSSILTTLGLIFCIVPGVYLIISYAFIFPLLLDRNLEFWDAMELSRKMVAKHWFQIAFLVLAAAAVGVMGAVACGIGILFTAPVGIAALMYAYEDIFNPGAKA